MLVLQRLPQQSITFGSGANAVTVKVLKVEGNKVKIGILAPPSIKVLRSELERHEEQGQ